MTTVSRTTATEHIAQAWSLVDEGKYAPCVAELEAALAILRPVPAEDPPRLSPSASGCASRGRKPVESDAEWWPDVESAALELGRAVGYVRSACNGCGYTDTVAGVAVRYSRYRTRAGWAAGRKVAGA